MSSDGYQLSDKELYCDHCKSVQIHSLDHLKSFTSGEDQTKGVDHYIAACIKCKYHCIYLRRQYSNDDVDYKTNEETGEVVGTYNYNDTYYQPVTDGDNTDLHLSIREDERRYIPIQIRSLLDELETAKSAGIWTLWSMGVRAVLEASMSAKGATSANLETKIQTFIASTSADQQKFLEGFNQPLFEIHYFGTDAVQAVPEALRENIAGLLVASLTIIFILPGRMDEIVARFSRQHLKVVATPPPVVAAPVEVKAPVTVVNTEVIEEEESPVQYKSLGETSVGETPVDETTVEESPLEAAEETPTDETTPTKSRGKGNKSGNKGKKVVSIQVEA